MLSRIGLPAVTAATAIFTTSRYFAATTSSTSKGSNMASAAPYDVRSREGGFPTKWPYKLQDFQRMDETDDDRFYSTPRFVTHIDDRCIDGEIRRASSRRRTQAKMSNIEALSSYYGTVLPQPSTSTSSTPKPRILDIASSWISHLPESWNPSNTDITGIGMNEAELSKNRALNRHLVLDLNKDPEGLSRLLSGDELYDAAVCSVSIDYLIKPREMLADLAKILKKDAGVHLAFSNRCFPSKVVGRWLRMDEDERCDMVADYFHFAGNDGSSEPGDLYHSIEIVTALKRSWSGDPLYVVRAKKV